MKNNSMLNGYAMTGTPAPVLLLGNDEANYKDIAILGADEPGYSAGNIGLNYLYPKPIQSPLDMVYTGNDAAQVDTAESGFALFPCLKECRGLSGSERTKCLSDCRGKKSNKQIKTQEADTDAKIAAAMEALAKDSTTPKASSNVLLWVVLVVFILAVITGVIFYVRSLNGAKN